MIHIPYGHAGIDFEEGNAAVLRSGTDRLKGSGNGQDLVRAAMAEPIDSPRLSELARGKKDCCIIISDHTRPVPSRDILPPMLQELREGSPDIRVTLLVATGCHRAATAKELEQKLGPELMAQCRVVMHDSRRADSNVRIGTLPSGAPLMIDREAINTELLVAEGFIEPHFFAGFSGGRKSVLPGICARETVLGNHCAAFIDSPFARTGILDGNPIHRDMLAACRMAGLQYIVNVIIDEEQKTVAAFAGDAVTAHRTGCDFLLDYCRVSPKMADVVITSNGGAPLDQNLYQCVKCMTAAEASCRENGVIIVCAECADGIGGDDFYHSLADCESVEKLYAEQMATPREKTLPDQWQSQILARILQHHTVILVSRPELRAPAEAMKLRYAASLGEALAQAEALGKTSLTLIPNGISVIVQ